MQTQSLSSSELEQVKQALALRAQQRGTIILGAQLGTLISQVLHPRAIKTVGGLRPIVENDLTNVIRLVPTLAPEADVRFEILGTEAADNSTTSNSLGPKQVSGNELWRLFSNPNISGTLACDAAGNITAYPLETPLPEAQVALQKPTSDDYRKLAEQFIEISVGAEMKSELQAALSAADFYNGWIDALRRLRNPKANPLNEWNAVRTEFVVSRLQENLATCGVDVAKAAEIVILARPAKTTRPAVPQGRSSIASTTADRSKPDIVWDLRDLVHEAVDLMHASDLREVRIPIGILHDLIERRRQAK
ncbi:hypothetical protein [Variovorax paradoxus]|jgi:hypothetical protein|uniref:hypothetical protein n=1 Tax=Variovorax paradoxus TaxID=34073 RepID=UPI0029C8790A|nr:hypothetical protein [Variovorax paradoxus]WPH20804.1 hypothetical protein RZE78_01265 [Variovorax paradoxus]